MRNYSWKKWAIVSGMVLFGAGVLSFSYAKGANFFYQFKALTAIRVLNINKLSDKPLGLTPEKVRSVYNLPSTGGKGTIAIISAYDAKTIENDLAVFSKKFNLPSCTVKNGCFEKYTVDRPVVYNDWWALSTALQVEWAHAIAPDAKLLLVQASTPSGYSLMKAVDYARARKDVVAVVLGFTGGEFSDETSYDWHFVSDHGETYFAPSSIDGMQVAWPAASPYVVAVGGTRLVFSSSGKFVSESAVSDMGGGLSQYEPQPYFQKLFGIPYSGSKRAVPDVAYNADTASGYSVYKTPAKGSKGWYIVGGTSAGVAQWAGIKALGWSADNSLFYRDKSSVNSGYYFRDILSLNSSCSVKCDVRSHYDFRTGLGSPLAISF